jgi:hypothetical protein
MGVFAEIWAFIKKCAGKIYNFFKKIFSVVFNGIKFVVECIISVLTTLKNSWFGKLIDGLSFIFDLLDFLERKGADVDSDRYKRELSDMNLNSYGNHRVDIVISN